MASRGGDKYAGVSSAINIVASGMEERRKRREEFSQRLQEAVIGKQLDSMFKSPESSLDLEKKQLEVEKLRREVGGQNVREISQDKSGLATLASESIRNIQEVKDILFPSGDPSSFKRMTAAAANIPGGNLPGIPEVAPFHESGQDVYRKVSAALAGRQLIQTGVAARPEETKKLYATFAPGFFSSSKATLNGLNELEAFYQNYITSLQTGAVGDTMPSGSLESQISSQLPPGSKIKSIRRIR